MSYDESLSGQPGARLVKKCFSICMLSKNVKKKPHINFPNNFQKMFYFYDSLYGLWVKGIYWCLLWVFFEVLWLHAYNLFVFLHKPSPRFAGQTFIITQILIYTTLVKMAKMIILTHVHRTALLVFCPLKPLVSSDRSIPAWQGRKISNTEVFLTCDLLSELWVDVKPVLDSSWP